MTDTLELKSKIIKKGFTIQSLANEIGISCTTLSYKINNKREFKSSEIKSIQLILHLTDEQRDSIFFNQNVDVKSTK